MNRGFSLMEIMVVVMIFAFLFGAILIVMLTSDRSFRAGQQKMTEQQEARRAMDNMAVLLRQSNPDWLVGGMHYPVSITGNNRIDFYQPEFDVDGAITQLNKVTFKLNPSNSSQLLKKVGISPEVVIGTYIESINFGAGCAGCALFNCSSVANDCPVVTIGISTRQGSGFSLSSKVTLRNTSVVLGDIPIEQPEEGEF